MFNSPKYGELSVEKENNLFQLNFPSLPPQQCETPINIIKVLGKEPIETLIADDYLVVYEKEEDILLESNILVKNLIKELQESSEIKINENEA